MDVSTVRAFFTLFTVPVRRYEVVETLLNLLSGQVLIEFCHEEGKFVGVESSRAATGGNQPHAGESPHDTHLSKSKVEKH